jgi:DNA recombination protein RmuC
MRATVEEKLQSTLEARLSESFRQVSERLEQVHRGLGEMQGLAQGVGDLKRVLTNVKSRGTYGEVQLGALLEQVLTAEQYGANVATRPGSRDRVEFAVRMPGREPGGAPLWLPIDAKFPAEDYERLLAAQEAADLPAMEVAAAALERRIRDEARSIREKYVEPPHTTDFAILFLPTEGLFAEVLRRPGLSEALNRELRVVVAGPTTLFALLNSLQMGFRTLAIEQRSAEVRELLGAVKTEFGRFGEWIGKVRDQVATVSRTLDAADTRTRAMARKLREVEALPAERSAQLLPPSSDDDG